MFIWMFVGNFVIISDDYSYKYYVAEADYYDMDMAAMGGVDESAVDRAPASALAPASEQPLAPAKVRSLFPETWLWTDKTVGYKL